MLKKYDVRGGLKSISIPPESDEIFSFLPNCFIERVILLR